MGPVISKILKFLSLIISWSLIVCKIPSLARALGLKAEQNYAAARPSARATIVYLVYKVINH